MIHGMTPSLRPVADVAYAPPTRSEPRALAESATTAPPLVRPDAYRASLRTPLDADRQLALLGETPFQGGVQRADAVDEAEAGQEGQASKDDKSREPAADGDLNEEQQQQVKELKKRDQEVRAHEQAHLAAAGGMASGGPSFSYETGPDGRKYAVGGEVQIAMRSGRTPEETIRNARQVQAAAMAPANPSSTDQQTAAAAARTEQEARTELASGGTGKGDETASPDVAKGKAPSATGAPAPEGSRPSMEPRPAEVPNVPRVAELSPKL